LRKRWGWTKILKALKNQKKEIDSFDAAVAREKHRSIDAFTEHFSYRKGNKMILFKKDAHIARQLRRLQGSPRFWDYIEEDEELEEVEQQ
jgi:hypothetical protein